MNISIYQRKVFNLHREFLLPEAGTKDRALSLKRIKQVELVNQV